MPLAKGLTSTNFHGSLLDAIKETEHFRQNSFFNCNIPPLDTGSTGEFRYKKKTCRFTSTQKDHTLSQN
jgi:hypothetical protein